MTNISAYSTDYNQETDNESWNFDHLNDLRDSKMEERGEEFEVELQLTPATNYFGHERIIVVSDGSLTPLSTLPTSMTDEWWPLVTDRFADNDAIQVNGRIWTSPETKEFYASVKIALPSIKDAEQEARDGMYLGADEGDGVYIFRTPRGFSNEFNDYLNPVWRKAHNMTKEQYDAEVEKTSREVEQILADREKASFSGRYTPRGSSAQDRSFALMDYNSTQKKPLIVWLLWLFLGTIGVHRFYLGDNKQGVLMLIAGLCFWFPGLIWALIDIFAINRRTREVNLASWSAIARKYGVSLEPAPEGVR